MKTNIFSFTKTTFTNLSISIQKMGMLAMFFGALLFLSCGGDDPEPPTPPTPVTITVAPQSVTLPATGGEQTVTVTTTVDWSAVPGDTWITVSKTSATALKVQVGINESGNDRSGKVNFTAGTATASITVTQSKPTAMQSDSLALVAMYNATAGNAWTNKWTLAAPVKQWYGVTVANNRVTHLRLANNNLAGALPAAIGNLNELQYAEFNNNKLTGALPATISSWTKVYYLDLSVNQLTGAFPELGALTKLVMFDASDNTFSGSLPASLSNATALEYLAFFKNNLSGTLPASWKALTKLSYVDASVNTITGAIPADWSTMTKMEAFYFYKNGLTGTIPAYICNFAMLQSLSLDGNNLTGAIPANLGNLGALVELWLEQNKLTGSIPASLLDNPLWSVWKEFVCPQQSGAGFDNCSGSPAPAYMQNSRTPERPRWPKDKYKR